MNTLYDKRDIEELGDGHLHLHLPRALAADDMLQEIAFTIPTIRGEYLVSYRRRIEGCWRMEAYKLISSELPKPWSLKH